MTADLPDVSVIVLGWNGREYVDGCLSSLLDQDLERPYEILFVDNGSTDGTPALAANYPGVRVHALDRNYGYCLGNNKGFDLSRGRYVVFLNQDVVAHRSWLRELVAAIESDPSIGAAHANIIQPWYPEFSTMERSAPVAAAYTADLSRLGYIHYRRLAAPSQVVDTLFLHGVSIVIERSLVEAMGYAFDPSMFAYAEDMDLGLRIRTQGMRTVVATRAVVYHKHTLEGDFSLRTLRKTVRIVRNRLLALWKNSTWAEFAVLAPVTIAGAPFNAGEFGLSPARRVAYFLGLIPVALLGAVAFAVAMPEFSARRRAVLRRRTVPRWWMVKAMLFGRGHLARQGSRDGAPDA